MPIWKILAYLDNGHVTGKLAAYRLGNDIIDPMVNSFLVIVIMIAYMLAYFSQFIRYMQRLTYESKE